MFPARSHKSLKRVAKIEDFLTALALNPPSDAICFQCGAMMKTVEAQFWMDGGDETWDLQLSYCGACDLEQGRSEVDGNYVDGNFTQTKAA